MNRLCQRGYQLSRLCLGNWDSCRVFILQQWSKVTKLRFKFRNQTWKCVSQRSVLKVKTRRTTIFPWWNKSMLNQILNRISWQTVTIIWKKKQAPMPLILKVHTSQFHTPRHLLPSNSLPRAKSAPERSDLSYRSLRLKSKKMLLSMTKSNLISINLKTASHLLRSLFVSRGRISSMDLSLTVTAFSEWTATWKRSVIGLTPSASATSAGCRLLRSD